MSEAQPETPEELVRHLEKLTGRTFRTREDIQAYVREVSARSVFVLPEAQRWVQTKRILLVALLAFGVIQYYMFDVLLQIVTMPASTYFAPVRAPLLTSMLDTWG